MNVELLNIGLSFIEGFALILSPCILPILPIVLAGSLTGNKQRPLGIILGFVLTFALFSYFAHTLIQHLGINANAIRQSAYVFLLLFGIILISNSLIEWFNRLTTKLSSVSSYANRYKGNDFCSGLFLGALISLIWTPCAGPILATVIVQIAFQKENIISFLTLLSFALGAAIPMFIIVFYIVHIKEGVAFFKKHALSVRKTLGVIIILNVVYMVTTEQFGYITSPTLSRTGIKTTNYLQMHYGNPIPRQKLKVSAHGSTRRH